jgi:hypothetical protein
VSPIDISHFCGRAASKLSKGIRNERLMTSRNIRLSKCILRANFATARHSGRMNSSKCSGSGRIDECLNSVMRTAQYLALNVNVKNIEAKPSPRKAFKGIYICLAVIYSSFRKPDKIQCIKEVRTS